MKNNLKKGIVRLIICVLAITILFFPNVTYTVSSDPPDHVFEGFIYDENEEPIPGIEVVITNLDTEDSDSVETDGDGYYYINIDDLQWSIPFKSRVTTIDPPEKSYLDASIEYSVEEGMYTYGGDLYLTESLGAEKRAQYTIPIGTLELYETGTYNAATQYQYWYPSDYTNVTSNTQREINPTMTLKLHYLRYDSFQHSYYYYIQTTKMYPGGKVSQYDQSSDFSFYPYHNATHSITSHTYQNSNTGKYWMETCGGFYIQVHNTIVNDWLPDGDGCGAKGYGAYFRVI